MATGRKPLPERHRLELQGLVDGNLHCHRRRPLRVRKVRWHRQRSGRGHPRPWHTAAKLRVVAVVPFYFLLARAVACAGGEASGIAGWRSWAGSDGGGGFRSSRHCTAGMHCNSCNCSRACIGRPRVGGSGPDRHVGSTGVASRGRAIVRRRWRRRRRAAAVARVAVAAAAVGWWRWRRRP